MRSRNVKINIFYLFLSDSDSHSDICYLLTVGVQGYCYTLSHSHTTPGGTPHDEGSATRRGSFLYNARHSQKTSQWSHKIN